MPGIFISYRRDGSSAYAGRLYDRLVSEFGKGQVFIDLSAIDPGADFVQRIESAVGSADALLVVIDPGWVKVRDRDGRPRLEDPEDFVRREVLGAFDGDRLVVPVLVGGATMPAEGDLPEALRPLARRNAIVLTDVGWSADVERLVASLRARIPRASRRRRRPRSRRFRWAVGALGLAAIAAGTLIATSGGDPPRPPTEGLAVAKEVPVGGYPIYTSAAGGRVWVLRERVDRLQAVEPDSGKVTQSGRLGRDLTGLAAAADRLWVGDYGQRPLDGKGAVVEVDPSTGRAAGAPIESAEPFEMDADGTSLWLVSEGGAVERVDLRARRVTARRRPADPVDVALLDGTAWVLSLEAGELLPYDARTGEPAGSSVKVGSRPISLAAGAGALWVVTEQGELYKVDPGGGRPESLVVGGEGRRVVEARRGEIWVADEQGTVTLVDPARLKVRASMGLGSGELEGVALDGTGAWVLRGRSRAESTVAHVVLERR